MNTRLTLRLALPTLLFCTLVPRAQAERATEAEMGRACERWLAYMVEQKGGWAGDAQPSIAGTREIVASGRVVGRSYAILPSGFVVVPILRELPPIKAYSETSGFDPEETRGLPQLIKDVLADRLARFEAAYGSLDARQPDTGDVLFARINRKLWDEFSTFAGPLKSPSDLLAPLTEAGPLMTTSWHQSEPYWDYCPMGDGGRCVVGCVATAAAQVLRYHQWPPEGHGNHTYYWPGDTSCGGSSPGAFLSANFSDPYDWAHMPDSCITGCTPEEEDALAELNYEVGVAFDMWYGHCGSGAYMPTAIDAFPEFFRYDDSIVLEERTHHTAESWFSMIKIEINSHRPILYGIIYHAIVCDGWRDTGGMMQYHMNYGWGGYRTGWYTLDNLYMSDPEFEIQLRSIFPTSWKVRVKADGSGDYPTIQAAIDAVPPGYVIQLEDGTYTGPGNRDLVISGKALTLCSLNGDPAECTIDCQSAGRGITVDSAGGACFRGITIKNAHASGAPPGDRGGAVYCYDSILHMLDCRLVGNEADGDGGGVCSSTSRVQVDSCSIVDNIAGGRGGGICTSDSSITFINHTVIAGNDAGLDGGGIASAPPSAMEIEHCALYGNRSGASGGGLYVTIEPDSTLTLRRSTLADNYAAGSGGGVYCDGRPGRDLERMLLWNNCAGGEGDDVYLASAGTSVRFACSNLDSTRIEGPGTFDWMWHNFSIDPGFCDPEDCSLAPTSAGDYHLKSTSPCAFGTAPLVCGTIGGLEVACGPNVFTVAPDGSGDFATIQDAVDSIPWCDVVELTDGTFTGPGNRDIDFGGKILTVRSQSGSPHSCVIDCEGLGRGFHFHSGEKAWCGVENLTVTGGQAASGGAVLCQSASPTIRGCVMAANSAAVSGGAVCCDDADPAIESCTLVGNSAPEGAGIRCVLSSPAVEKSVIAMSPAGEAVSCDSTSSPELACCDVYGNGGGDWTGCIQGLEGSDGNFSQDPVFCDPDSADFRLDSSSPCVSAPGCGRVGALGVGCWQYRAWHVPGDAPTIQAGVDSASAGDTVLVACGTYAEADLSLKSGIVLRSETGQADCVTIDAQGEGRVFWCVGVDSTASIEGLTLTGGAANGVVWPDNTGGAMYCENSSLAISGCVFDDNSAAYGGAVTLRYSSPAITQCTFVYNSASGSGAGIYSSYSTLHLENSIIALSGDGEAVDGYQGSAQITCSDLYGNAGGDWVGWIAGKDTTGGNFSADPCFCEPFTGHVTVTSPCAPDSSPAGCGLVGALGVGCELTEVPEADRTLPARLTLGPAVPNPFNPVTAISYAIPAGKGPERVTLTVYNCLGQRVKTLVDADQPPGFYSAVWDGTDQKHRAVASGVYFYRIAWNGKSETKRMVLLK